MKRHTTHCENATLARVFLYVILRDCNNIAHHLFRVLSTEYDDDDLGF